jgi:predicted HNH restriction endonuclease
MANKFYNASKKPFMNFVSKNYPNLSLSPAKERVSYQIHGRNIVSLLPDGDGEIILNLAPVGSIPNTGVHRHHEHIYTSYKLTTSFDSDKQAQKMVVDYLRQAQQSGWEMIEQEYPSLEQETQDIEEVQTEFDQRKQEILEDNEDLKNEKEIVVSQRVKRYQKIVRDLKDKYENKCQIEDCGFTFEQKNGNLYSEGHHLVPLSEDGPQSYSNVVILCPNHHRMFHYAKVEISDIKHDKRKVKINGIPNFIIY